MKQPTTLTLARMAIGVKQWQMANWMDISISTVAKFESCHPRSEEETEEYLRTLELMESENDVMYATTPEVFRMLCELSRKEVQTHKQARAAMRGLPIKKVPARIEE